jgi:hypothetical protein
LPTFSTSWRKRDAREPHRSFLRLPHGRAWSLLNRKVGAVMTYEEQIDAVIDEMNADIQMERRVDSIIRELDELCAFAANGETVDLVEKQRIAVGQIVTRATLIASFLMARNHKPGLRVVQNNGR